MAAREILCNFAIRPSYQYNQSIFFMSTDPVRRERPQKERPNFYKTRAMSGMFMGFLYCALALFFAFYKKEETIQFIGNNAVLAYILLGLMFAYGLFRIFRGFKMLNGKG